MNLWKDLQTTEEEQKQIEKLVNGDTNPKLPAAICNFFAKM